MWYLKGETGPNRDEHNLPCPFLNKEGVLKCQGSPVWQAAARALGREVNLTLALQPRLQACPSLPQYQPHLIHFAPYVIRL